MPLPDSFIEDTPLPDSFVEDKAPAPQRSANPFFDTTTTPIGEMNSTQPQYVNHRRVGAYKQPPEVTEDINKKIGSLVEKAPGTGTGGLPDLESYQNLGLAAGGEVLPSFAGVMKNPAVRRGLLGASVAVNAWFAKQMAKHGLQQGKEAADAYKRGDYLEMAAKLGHTGIDGLLTAAGIRGLARTAVVAEPMERYKARQEAKAPSERDLGLGGTRGPVQPDEVFQGGPLPAEAEAPQAAKPEAAPIDVPSSFVPDQAAEPPINTAGLAPKTVPHQAQKITPAAPVPRKPSDLLPNPLEVDAQTTAQAEQFAEVATTPAPIAPVESTQTEETNVSEKEQQQESQQDHQAGNEKVQQPAERGPDGGIEQRQPAPANDAARPQGLLEPEVQSQSLPEEGGTGEKKPPQQQPQEPAGGETLYRSDANSSLPAEGGFWATPSLKYAQGVGNRQGNITTHSLPSSAKVLDLGRPNGYTPDEAIAAIAQAFPKATPKELTQLIDRDLWVDEDRQHYDIPDLIHTTNEDAGDLLSKLIRDHGYDAARFQEPLQGSDMAHEGGQQKGRVPTYFIAKSEPSAQQSPAAPTAEEVRTGKAPAPKGVPEPKPKKARPTAEQVRTGQAAPIEGEPLTVEQQATAARERLRQRGRFVPKVNPPAPAEIPGPETSAEPTPASPPQSPNGETAPNPETPAKNISADTARPVSEPPEARQPASAPAYGAPVDVAVPGEEAKYKARYAIRDLADVQPSHNGLNFEANPSYEFQNDRDYKNNPEISALVSQRSGPAFDPAYAASESVTAENGGPVIDPRGNVLGGNSRTMTLQRVYDQNPEGAERYKAALRDRAGLYGIKPEDVDRFKRPVMVREMTTQPDEATAQRAITDFNKKSAASLAPAERAIADGRRLSDETVQSIAAKLENVGEDSTLAQALQGDNGAKIVDGLVRDGVISQQERGALIDDRGLLTTEAKDRISKMLVGRMFESPAQYQAASPELRAKLERIAPQVLRLEGRPEWNVTPEVREGLSLLADMRARGGRNIDDYLAQPDLNGQQKQYSPQAIAMARTLGNGPVRAAQSFRQFANDEMLSREGQPATFFEPPSRESAFQAAFGTGAEGALARKNRLEKLRPAELAKVDYKAGKNGGPGTLYGNEKSSELLSYLLRPNDEEGSMGSVVGLSISREGMEMALARARWDLYNGGRLPWERDELRNFVETAKDALARRDPSFVYAEAQPFGDLRRTLREERFHFEQRKHARMNGEHIDAPALFEHPLAETARNHLLEMEYPDEPDILAAEIGAKIAAGDWESLGLDENGAKDLFQRYAGLLVERHGPGIVFKFRSISPILKEAFYEPGKQSSIAARRSAYESQPMGSQGRAEQAPSSSGATGEGPGALDQRSPQGQSGVQPRLGRDLPRQIPVTRGQQLPDAARQESAALASRRKPSDFGPDTDEPGSRRTRSKENDRDEVGPYPRNDVSSGERKPVLGEAAGATEREGLGERATASRGDVRGRTGSTLGPVEGPETNSPAERDLNPDDLEDLAAIGAHYLQQHGPEKFDQHMVDEFGASVRPHLDQIRAAAELHAEANPEPPKLGPIPPDSRRGDAPGDLYLGSGLGAFEPLFREAKAEGDALRVKRNEALKAAQAAEATPGQQRAGEAVRSYFTAERDLWAARTNQAIDIVVRKVLPKIQDREALGIMREFRHRQGELQSMIDGTHPIIDGINSPNPLFDKAKIDEARQRLLPVMREAMRMMTNPTPKEAAADRLFTKISDKSLKEGEAGGWLGSRWQADEYVPHLLNKTGEGEVAVPPSTAGRIQGKVGKFFGFALRRADPYPTNLHGIFNGIIPKTLDPAVAFTVHADAFARARATHLLEAHLADYGLGKWGDGNHVPQGWVQLARHTDEFKKSFVEEDPFSGESRVGKLGLYVPEFINKALEPITDPDWTPKMPGFANLRTAQRGLKEAILGLSGFHLLTENVMAAGDIGPSGMYQALFKSPRESRWFVDQERDFIGHGGTTSIQGSTMDAYRGLQPGTIPTRGEVIRSYIPGTKQALQVADKITRLTFDNVQRRFKVVSFALHRDAWIRDNPNATKTQLADAKKGIASYVNGVYGGLHWENMGIPRAMVEVSRALLLAPDWSGSNIALGKYAFDAKPAAAELRIGQGRLAGATTKESAQARLSRAFWTKLIVGGLIGTQLLSLTFSGKMSKRPFQVYEGKDRDGNDVYQNVLFRGSAGDLVNLANKMEEHGLLTGAGIFLGGKAAPISKLGIHIVTGRNDMGKEIAPRGLHPVANTLRSAGSAISDLSPIPITARQISRQMTGDQSDKFLWSERMMSLFGPPAQHVDPFKEKPQTRSIWQQTVTGKP